MLLRVKVKPNAKSDEVVKDPDGTIRVRIKAPPVDGKANKYLVGYLAEYFGLPRSSVRLLKGETSANKTIEIDAEEAHIMTLVERPVETIKPKKRG